MSKMREEFEAWVTRFRPGSDVDMDEEFPDEYLHAETQYAWEGWQASCAARRVEPQESTAPTPAPSYRDPDYMREQQRLAARDTERRALVRELMLRHPELNGQQAIAQADEILETLEGLANGR